MMLISKQHPPRVFYGLVSQGLPVPLWLGLTEDGKVCRVHFAPKNAARSPLKSWQSAWPSTAFIKDQRAVEVWWKKAMKLKSPPPILLVGTPFQALVCMTLLTIPAGETITYGELAERIGSPKAIRAVGAALGKNPVAFFLPCHRVVTKGGLGGFAGGTTLKRHLLQSEGAKVLR
ncbi:MAG: methylated-DNA--[protein]-cysteine S-methyltransferase [Bdellovibrionales bacterium]|jgi:AraC family transcriptional regulator of adaptative response/methylated-DNA-[protein]-cysteine methyltransferase